MAMSDKAFSTAPGMQRRSAWSLALAVIANGLCLVVAAAILATRQRFSQWFEEFGVQLPAIARFAVSPVLPALLGLFVLAAVGMELASQHRASQDRFNLAVLLLAVVSLAVYVVGVFTPLMSLVDSLSR